MALRILHLTGSATRAELDDLSRLYARGAIEALHDPARYESLIAHVSPDGAWRFPSGLEDPALATAAPMSISAAVGRLCELGIDAMVPHMFCLPGMTTYRALFELLDIPYVGNRPAVMALAARKDQARAIMAAAGVNVPTGRVVGPGDPAPAEFPVVVKPVDADNSDGVTLVHDLTAYAEAIEHACAHGSAALVEQFVAPGREVRCGILERDGALHCLPLEEYPVDDVEHPIREAADKLRRTGAGELELVAKSGAHAWIVDPEDPVSARVGEVARRGHLALGCRHYSLWDFRIDQAGQPWFLEAGLYCSFSPQSVVATMAEAAGIPVRELFSLGLHAALGDRAVNGVPGR